MNKPSVIFIFLLLAQGQILFASPPTELDEKHDYRHAPSMETGKRLYTAGICTIIAGGVAVAFLQRILSTNLYGTNSSTYFAPYNYPFILGDGLLALGTKKMADYVSTGEHSKFRKNRVAFPIYLVATALDITGLIMLSTQSPSGKTAAYLPVELSNKTAPGAIVSTTGSVLHIVNTVQYLVENRKIRNEVAVRIIPSIDPQTRRSRLCLSFSIGL